jgi:hypothetical protein
MEVLLFIQLLRGIVKCFLDLLKIRAFLAYWIFNCMCIELKVYQRAIVKLCQCISRNMRQQGDLLLDTLTTVNLYD